WTARTSDRRVLVRLAHTPPGGSRGLLSEVLSEDLYLARERGEGRGVGVRVRHRHKRLEEEVVHVVCGHLLRPQVDAQGVALVCVPEREYERLRGLFLAAGALVCTPAYRLYAVVRGDDAQGYLGALHPAMLAAARKPLRLGMLARLGAARRRGRALRPLYESPRYRPPYRDRRCRGRQVFRPGRGEGNQMKGLILAAGLGTRLRPLTSLRPKPTIAVANKPLIHYAVDNLVDAGVDHIGVVVGPPTEAPIRETLEGYRGARFEYVMQDPPLGLAHAVKVARPFLGDDPFVMYLSDNLFEHGIKDFVAAYDPGAGVNAVLALVEVPDPRQLGVAVVEGGRIERLVEKPADPPSNLAVAGVYVFDAKVHAAIDGLEPGAKGEYQITDAIQRMIEAGDTVAPVVVSGWWKDTGKAEDILDANRLVLGRL